MKTVFRILGLLAILLIAFSIFIAIKPSEYDVIRTKNIKAPSSIIFSTVNEHKTWIDWSPWKANDPTIKPSYPEQTSGIGGGHSWTSEQGESGRMETVAMTEFSSIDQKIYFDKRGDSDVYWRFDEKENETDVTWGMKGKLDFVEKAYFYFMGGTDKAFGKMFEDGLNNLDSYVLSGMDTYSITNEGIVEYSGGFFIHLTTECSFEEQAAQLNEMLPKVLLYAIQENYPRAGSIFNLYHKYDVENKIVSFSSCVPVKERVNPEGAIALAYMESGKYHKTSLQGAYKYSNEAWEKAFKFAVADGVQVIEDGKPFEVYTKGHTDSPNPADWVTEIYLPIE